jgi:hypothetical protein
MSEQFNAATSAALVVAACAAARRWGWAPTQQWKVGIALASGLFVTLLYALMNEVTLTPRTAGTLLLLAASDIAAGLGVFYDGGQRETP